MKARLGIMIISVSNQNNRKTFNSNKPFPHIMIIKSLHLKNIRSYKEQEFFFREGTTLLSGDIGSGKSSVLLSIEFALFGLIRGSINGSSLLRHGQKEAVVKLKFQINKDEYAVERTLKRTSTGITQDKCSFTKNNETQQLTLRTKKQNPNITRLP